MVEMNVTYFEKPGDHTTEVLACVRKAADQLGIKTIVLATTWGNTAKAALEVFDPDEFNIVVVTHSFGFAKPGECELPDDLRQELTEKGLTVVTGGHPLSGVDSALIKKINTWTPTAIFQRGLRWIVCDGFKVCLEISAMAVDAGAVRDLDRDLIAIAGTGKGADTACLIKPKGTREFLDARVKMILAKPQ